MITQATTLGSLFAAGDFLCQGIEMWNPKKEQEEQKSPEGLDLPRIARMTSFGLFLEGPAAHYWYLHLDKTFPGRRPLQLVKKVSADQFIFGPIYLSLFFVYVTILEGKSWSEAKLKLKTDFWPTFKMDVAVWPAAQTINFLFVPGQYRILYLGVVSIFWNAYLSRVQHVH